MGSVRGSIVLCIVGFLLLCAQSAWPRLLAPDPGAPYLLVPIVVALGASRTVAIGRGASTAFVLGYLMDLFTGNALGPFTFAFVVAFLAAKLLGSRLSFRGVSFEMIATFVVAAIVMLVIHTVRTAFSPDSFVAERGPPIGPLLLTAIVTAVLAPFIIALARRADPQIAKFRAGVAL